MAKSSNIVHQYFKKEFTGMTPDSFGDGAKILVKVNPVHWTGTEITLLKNGEIQIRELEFDEEIFEDLKADGFEESSPLEFNLYFSGLA